MARCGLVPSKCAAKLSGSGAEGSWGRRGQLAAMRLPVAGNRACLGVVLSAVSTLQVYGKEYNKVCFPLFLSFFIPYLSSDFFLKKVATDTTLSFALLGCAGQSLVLFSLTRCSQASEIMLFLTGVSPRPSDNYW